MRSSHAHVGCRHSEDWPHRKWRLPDAQPSQAQREYRFAVWVDEDPRDDAVDLHTVN